MIVTDSLLHVLAMIGVGVALLVLLGRWLNRAPARRREDPRICPGCYNVVKRHSAASCPYCGTELYWKRRARPAAPPSTPRPSQPTPVREPAAQGKPARPASLRIAFADPAATPTVAPHAPREIGEPAAPRVPHGPVPVEPIPESVPQMVVPAIPVDEVGADAPPDAARQVLNTDRVQDPTPSALVPDLLPRDAPDEPVLPDLPVESAAQDEWEVEYQEWEREERAHRRKEFLYAFLAAVVLGWFLAALLFVLR